jgi:hypothetical protein
MHASTAHPKGLGALAQKNPNPRASPLFPFRSRTSSSSCWRERATWRARARHLLKPRWLLALATRACVRTCVPQNSVAHHGGRRSPLMMVIDGEAACTARATRPHGHCPPPLKAPGSGRNARAAASMLRATLRLLPDRFGSIPFPCVTGRARPFGCQPGRANQPHGGRIGSNRTRRMHGMWGAWWGRLAGRGRLDRADRTVGFDGNVAPFVRWLSLFSALSFPYQRSWTYNFVSYHTYVASLRNLFFPSIQKNVLSPCVRNLCAISSSGCGI